MLNKQTTVKRFVKLLKREKLGFTTIFIMGLFANASITATPFLMGVAIDNLVNLITQQGLEAIQLQNLTYVIRTPIMWMIGLTLLMGIAVFVQEYTMATISEDVTFSLRASITDKFLRLPMNFFDTHQVGDVMSRTTSDLRKVSAFLVQNINQALASVMQVVLGTIMLFYIHSTLALVVVVVMLLSVKATQLISRKNKELAERSQVALGELNSVVEEMYSGNTLVKAFNKQADAEEKVATYTSSYTQAFQKARFIEFTIYPAIRMLSQLSFVASSALGAVFVIQGSLSMGNIQAFLQYVNQISEPITTSSYVINSIQTTLTAMERYFEILDSEEQVPEVELAQLPIQLKGNIEFNHVKFGYSPAKELMKDVSFEAKPNQMVAIVGPTGAGKTTLVNLLMRFYELNSGQILVDGIDITHISRSELRSLFGMVLQDAWLFDGTIADNIAYGKRDATRAEIIQAAKAAQVDYFIRTLPHGYDTVIENGGNTISQGQQQLLTIARVLLVNPNIVILDEATSSVDTQTEVAVQTAMKKIQEGRTSFVIAHRLSTIMNADLILVMQDGDIIEQGAHQELLEANGFYKQLYNSQYITA